MLKEDVDALLPMKQKFLTIGADEDWFLRNFFQVSVGLSNYCIVKINYFSRNFNGAVHDVAKFYFDTYWLTERNQQ